MDSAPAGPGAVRAAMAGVAAPGGDGDQQVTEENLRPRLGDPELAVLARYGREVRLAPGDVLFAEGDPGYDLVVVLEGRVDIVEALGRANETVIVEYGTREFLGEIGLLTGQRVFLSAVARSAGRALRIPPEAVRTIIAQEPALSDLVLRAFLLRHGRLTRQGLGLTLAGSRLDPNTRRLLEVLARNRVAFRWVEVDEDAGGATWEGLAVPRADLPLVIAPGVPVLRNPTAHELLAALGLVLLPGGDEPEVCDLLVVGAGPAGLSAAVYGASEGMTTTLAEGTALGGQAGTSSRIENYLGFPAGVSGDELTARGVMQARKFGARLKLGAAATALSSDGDRHHVTFDDGDVVTARSVIIATGAQYNRLPLDRLADFEGAGVYYAATEMEAQACAGGPVVLVGGGNSAGQAALFLSRRCTAVELAIRGADLAASMSHYLVEQIERAPNISVRAGTEVLSLLGSGRLEAVELADRATGRRQVRPVRGLFVFIGATPCTAWLGGQLAEDGHGFLLTGAEVPASWLEHSHHSPLVLEASRPGIFCVGDVRSGSVKRVATAIGEGSMAVRLVYERLQATGLAVAPLPRTVA